MRNLTYGPKCNHCDYEYDSDETWYGSQDISKGDCENTELKCLCCDEIFHVACVHETKFATVDEHGDEI